MATVNDFEREFARFLGRAPDVLRFAALGTTEQGDRGAALPGDCVQPSGAIGVYCPDWVVVQRDHSGEVNWIVETKGRVRHLVVSVVSERIFRERDLAPERTMTAAEVREARDDGRA